METPITGTAALAMAVLLGIVFGVLLHRGRVADYDVIVNQFRLRDFTVLKVMLTAIIVGGVGVLAMHAMGAAEYEIKPALLLGVGLGAAIFGVGMVLYGYCPGTGIAATAAGSVHAFIGLLGMLAGGALYAWTYPWVNSNLLSTADFGKQRLPDITGVPDVAWFAGLIVAAGVIFYLLERNPRTAFRREL